jgi:hypothetical protein
MGGMGDGMGGPACDGGLAGRGVGRIALLRYANNATGKKVLATTANPTNTRHPLTKKVYIYLYIR